MRCSGDQANRGEASDPVKYFANPDNQKCLGIVKKRSTYIRKSLLPKVWLIEAEKYPVAEIFEVLGVES